MNSSDSSKKPRSVAILLVSLMGTALIIGAFIYLNPLEDAPESESDLETTSGLADWELAGEAMVVEEVSIESLALPSEAREFAADELRKQLEELAKQLREGFPNAPAAHHVAAQIYSELKQTQLALEAWTKALELTKEQTGPYVGVAEIHMQNGAEEQAVEILQEALEQGLRTPEILLSYAEAQENLGELDAARKLLMEASSQDSANPKLWQDLARVEMQLQHYADAERYVRKAISIQGATEASLFTLSNALVRQSKKEAAEQVRSQLTDLQQRQQATGETSFQDKYETALVNIAFRLYLSAASVANQSGDPQQAEAWVRDAIAIRPDGLQAYMSLAGLYLERKEVGKAIAVHKLLLEKQPDNVLNYVNLASLVSQVGNQELAESTLKKAVAIDPQGTLAQASLAKLYIGMNRPEDARLLAADVVTRSPSAEAYVLLATSYEAGGEIEAAKAAIGKAQRIWPNHPLWKQGAPTPDPTPSANAANQP